MENSKPRPIVRSVIAELADRLPQLGGDYGSRDFDVDLFRAFDTSRVRTAKRVKLDVVEQGPPHDPGELRIHALDPIAYDDWVSETPEVGTTYFDDDGNLASDIAQFGYLDQNGEFVKRPVLDPIPDYTRDIGDALEFKWRVFQSYLKLQITEIDGEWGNEYRAVLLNASDEAVHAYQADTLPHAIIGASLGALLSGWTHDRASYDIIPDK